MTTREKIYSITDPGLFEQLCSAMLRKQRRELAGLSHLGTNSKGQTIKGPIDNFKMLNENSNISFVAIQHTINKDIDRKWLGASGDVDKSAMELASIRKIYPDAVCELILTTSAMPDIELLKALTARSKDLNLKISSIDQSEIAHYLDHEPDGQWLRHKFLGIDYELPSVPALTELSKKDFRQYQISFSLPDLKTMIKREIEFPQIEERIVLVVAKSGYGKTSYVSQLWDTHLQLNRNTFWLSVELIQTSLLFELCIKTKLKQLKDNLFLDDKNSWLNKELWDSTIFIIDDINRVANKREVINRLVQFAKDAMDAGLKLTFIVPVWEEVQVLFPKDNEYISQIFLQRYSIRESREVLKKFFRSVDDTANDFQLDEVANDLNRDPLLIGLFQESWTTNNSFQVAAQNALQSFIGRCIEPVVENNDHVLTPEVHLALNLLGKSMLEKRELVPNVNDLSDWLKDNADKLFILKQLISKGKLLSHDPEGRINFRHDRVRDEIIAKSLNADLGRFKTDERFKEIFYAYFIGKALAISDNIPDGMLAWLLGENPIAFFEFIRLTPEKALKDKNLEVVIEWIKGSLNPNYNITLEERCKSLLFWTNSILVTKILPSFERYDRPVCLTEIKHGMVNAAIRFLFNKHKRDEAFWFDYYENVAFSQFHQRDKIGLVMELNIILSEKKVPLSEMSVIGGLSLACLLEDASLLRSIQSLFAIVSTHHASIPYFIRAYLTCGGALQSDFWQTIMTSISTIKENKHVVKIQKQVYELENIISSELDFVLEKVKRDILWKNVFQEFLCHFDAIPVIEFILDDYTTRYPINAEKVIYYGFIEKARRYFDYKRNWQLDKGWNEREFSDSAINYLLSQWTDGNNSVLRQWFAFILWETRATSEDLPLLRAVPSNAAIFHAVYVLRIELGDMECVGSYGLMVKKDPRLLNLAHYIWCDEVKNMLHEFLRSLQATAPTSLTSDHFIGQISNLFVKLPLQDVETLMVENWDSVKYINEFLKTALYLDSSKLNQIASSFIDTLPDKQWIFQSLHWTYGVNMKGRSHLITVEKLERLKPYLNDIDAQELFFFSTSNDRSTFWWWEKNIPLSVKHWAGSSTFPTDQQLLTNLVNRAGEIETNNGFDLYLDQIRKGGISDERILKVVSRWLESMPTILYHQFLIGSRTISLIGKRTHVDLLRQIMTKVTGDQKQTSLQFESTRYEVFLNSLR